MAPKFGINIHSDAADLTSVPISFSTTGINIVIAGVAGQIIRVYKIFFAVSAATNITIQNGTNALSGAMNFSANEGLILDFDTKPWFTTSDGQDFTINQSGTAQVSGTVYYQYTAI